MLSAILPSDGAKHDRTFQGKLAVSDSTDLSQDQAVYDLNFNPAGTHLFVTHDQRIKVWSVFADAQAVLDYAQAHQLGDLTEAQKQQFFLE